jgi:hypothetical protein
MTKRRAACLTSTLLAAACGGADDAAKPAKAAGAGPSSVVFEERAAAAGIKFRMGFLPGEQGEKFKINVYDHGCGVAVGDYDGDGHDDVYFVNQMGGGALYRNAGDGTFADVTAAAGADLSLGDRIGTAAAWADYDNDGRADLYVASTRGGNALFHNEGGGKFVDATKKAGVELVAHSEGATFFDADKDGFLDLLVCNTGKWTNDELDPTKRYWVGPRTLFEFRDRPIEKNAFYRNNGDGTFSDRTEESGLGGFGWNCQAVAFDYDDDGAPDVFVTSMFGASSLYRNAGGGRFVDKTVADLGPVSFGALGAALLDVDGDGRLDLYVADMHSDMWITPDVDPKVVDEKKKYRAIFGPMVELGKMSGQEAQHLVDASKIAFREVVFGNTLYRNLGAGGFEEISDKTGAETFWPWGVVPADFRNAGVEDVFVPSGMGYPFFFWKDEYLMNTGAGAFVGRAKEAGVDPPPGGVFQDAPIGGAPATRSSRAAAAADFDGDGRVDLVVNNFNGRAHLYMNRSPAANWAALRLTGTKSNRDAVGAVVTVKAGGKTLVRQVQTGGAYLSQSSRTLHFGLGAAKSVESCEIRWPSGVRQVVENLAVGRRTDVTEPAK